MILRRCLSSACISCGPALYRQWHHLQQGPSRWLHHSGRALAGTPIVRRGHMACSSVAMSNDNTGAVIVYVTVPSEEVGEKIAGMLVNPEARLAACVNIVSGLKSIYWWDDKVQKDSELLLIMKTQAALLQQLVDTVKSHHPYDEPEVISLPISGGSQSYLKWIHDSTGA
ncbi:hypothetical protein CVIRNUC_001614 [Coccomyxa viridis]|uniref:Uncharacterized protein n=1 Tax=Coccomyxa viridis TaxID=1274662 RepID=A0AAV1HXQ0_9CHLO|nr:hypothetical protein CVIRNUC_001614 [Coccomyxa viridis]